MNSTRVRILCHNTAWFQGWPYEEWPRDPVPEVLEGLAKLYADVRADLVCLQEIQNAETFVRLSEALGMQGAYCAGGRQAYYGGAALWRSGRIAAESCLDREAPVRFWQSIELPLPEGVLRVANLHLASARDLSEEEAAEARLVDISRLLSRQPGLDVVAGDFNENDDGKALALLTKAGYVESATLVDDPPATTVADKNRRSDRIFLHQRLLPRFRAFEAASWEQLAIARPGQHLLSDHMPIWVDLDPSIDVSG